ncbi:MAG: RNA methyltransferase [Opitutaceae bacterium]|nr:RNA methyltransferase [Opitutaceae bacterium]
MPDSIRAKPATAGQSGAAWPAAARLIARWLDRRERVDVLFTSLGGSLSGTARARCQHLVFGVMRHFGRLEADLGRLVSHPPRFPTRAVLFVAGFELIEAINEPAADGRAAKIVHHAVEQAKHLASPAEAKLVNAVVRKLAGAPTPLVPAKLADADTLAEYYSHPAWLVRRWLTQFGAEPTRRLLEWNQQPAPAYARWRPAAAGKPAPRPDWLKPTVWAGYFEVPSGRWSDVEPLLKTGQLYLQDPGMRLATELLAPKAGETVLDACAAPGGKSLLIADALQAGMPAGTMASAGRIVALDLPGARIDRLKENLARVTGVDVALVQADLLRDGYKLLDEHGLPTEFAAVLIDVPCSNTGVMRHRVDVKWRLQEGVFRKHAAQQLALLHAAARLVAPGGRIVYSTCSIDAEENERVIKAFFDSRAGSPFKREASVLSYPWESGHDGAGVFCLRRQG